VGGHGLGFLKGKADAVEDGKNDHQNDAQA
jgi:hypothetical protein